MNKRTLTIILSCLLITLLYGIGSMQYNNKHQNEINWESMYNKLSSEHTALQEKYNSLLEENETLKEEIKGYNYQELDNNASDIKETEEKERASKEYADLLIKYGDAFASELDVLSNQRVSQLVKDNASIDELSEEISSSLSRLGVAENNLQNYYDKFDSNRTQLPMGTPIMTLLSDAQSALRQYTIALQHLQDYLINPKQEYIDSFVEYTEKATDSLNSFNELFSSEKKLLE